MSAHDPPVRPSSRPVFGWETILFLSVVTALEALAIDMYLPAFPAVADAFQATPGAVQQTLSVFLIGLGLGQGLYGYFLDRHGRRIPLLAGMGLFVAGTAAVALAPSLQWMLMARFVQAIGAAAGLVAPRAIIRDECDVQTSARLLSILMQVMTIGPILAPILGDTLLGLAGWRSIFWTLALIGMLCLVWGLRATPETLPRERRVRHRLASLLSAYGQQAANPSFMAYGLASGFTLASLFLYIAASPFVAIQHFGLTPTQFSYYFAGNAVGLIAVGQVNLWLLKTMPGRRILAIGLAIQTVAAVLLVLAVQLGVASAGLYLSLLALVVWAFRLVAGNLAAVTMGQVQADFGVASSLMGFLQYVVAGAVGLLAGLASNRIASLPVALAACGLFAWMLCARASKAEAPSAEAGSA